MAEILVLQHVSCEPPAAYGPELKRVGALRIVNMGVDPLPATTEFEAVVAMGGPMGFGDRDRISWLQPEVDYLRAALAADIPIWGVCLGAQLLAAALGADVYTGAVPEVGIGDVRLTPEGHQDAVWGDFDAKFPVFQWHSDSFDLPAGAELLASSELYPNQVYRHRSSYGVQFHMEASVQLAKEWLDIPEYRASLEEAQGPDSAPRLLAALEANEVLLLSGARRAIHAWLETCVVTDRSR